MHDTSTSNIAPSGSFRGSALDNGDVDINCNNPLLSAQEATALCGGAAGTGALVPVQLGRRNIEGGPRTADFEHENYRIVLGLRGDLGDAWHYDGYGSYYYTSLYTAVGWLPQHPGHAGRPQRQRDLRQSGLRHRRRLRSVEHLRHRAGQQGGAELPHRARHRARSAPKRASSSSTSPATSASTAGSRHGPRTASA